MPLLFLARKLIHVLLAAGLAVIATATLAKPLALTVDDGFAPGAAPEQAIAMNQAMLNTLAAHRVRAMLFPAGAQLDSDLGWALVADWGRAGHRIGNHSYHHQAYSATDFDAYTQDLALAQQRLAAMPGWCPRLRFPYLDEGQQPAQQQRMRHWLAEHGYGVAPATMTLADWEDNVAYEKLLSQDNAQAAAAFRQAYVTQWLSLAAHQQQHWQQVLQGRDPAHVLLLHANRLNTDILPMLLPALQQQGWRFIDPEQAFQDPIYQRRMETEDGIGTTLPMPRCGP